MLFNSDSAYHTYITYQQKSSHRNKALANQNGNYFDRLLYLKYGRHYSIICIIKYLIIVGPIQVFPPRFFPNFIYFITHHKSGRWSCEWRGEYAHAAVDSAASRRSSGICHTSRAAVALGVSSRGPWTCTLMQSLCDTLDRRMDGCQCECSCVPPACYETCSVFNHFYL